MKMTKLYLWYPSFLGVGQGMKMTKLYLWYPSFLGVGQGIKVTKLYLWYPSFILQIQLGLLHTLTYTNK
jgi:hypothetical protein